MIGSIKIFIIQSFEWQRQKSLEDLFCRIHCGSPLWFSAAKKLKNRYPMGTCVCCSGMESAVGAYFF